MLNAINIRLTCSVALVLLLTTCGPTSLSSGGGRWELVTTDNSRLPHLPSIRDIHFTDPQHGWALEQSRLTETADGGATWTEVLEDDLLVFHSFTFNSPSSGWIVGAEINNPKFTKFGALIMHTADAGKHWEKQKVDLPAVNSVDETPYLNSVSVCGNTAGWAVGQNVIVHTSDGTTWTTQYRGKNGELLHGVFCADSNRAWVVGSGGLILHTADGGTSWTRQRSNTQKALLQVTFTGDDGLIVGLDGVLLQSADGGANWEQRKLDFSGTLFDVYFNGSLAWVVGDTGYIAHSQDKGQTWQQQKTPTLDDLTSVFFLDPQHGWAGGGSRTILRFSN